MPNTAPREVSMFPSGIAGNGRRLAPSAVLTANSDWRALARTSRRFAMLTHPISSTNATPPCSNSSVGRTGLTRSSCTPPTFIVMPERSTNCFSGAGPAATYRFSMSLASASAWPAPTPGLRRANNWMPTP
jgi:hypothetical protein